KIQECNPSALWDNSGLTFSVCIRQDLQMRADHHSLCIDWQRMKGCMSKSHAEWHICSGCSSNSHRAQVCPL
ncbi:hypothetical protein BDZ97DRAFT_1677003, partial [Flammula alnicola]